MNSVQFVERCTLYAVRSQIGLRAATGGRLTEARRRISRPGPDRYLRIGPEGIEFVEVRFLHRHHQFRWPDITKWGMSWATVKRRTIWIELTASRRLHIDPVDYAWSFDPYDTALAGAKKLEHRMEALFKEYARDRQGGTEKMDLG